MIGPKPQKLTAAEKRRAEGEAYELATLRDSGTCQRCRKNCGPVARDHRRNRSQGGLTVVANLQCLGLDCHTWKTDHPEKAIADGWAVPGWVFWEEWPARRWLTTAWGAPRLGWVLYDDIGGWVEITDREAHYRITGSVPF